MEKKSKSDSPFLVALKKASQEKKIPEKIKQIVSHFYASYQASVETHSTIFSYDDLFFTFLELIEEQLRSPFTFQPFHQQIRTPFDYYKFGLDFFRPLVDMQISSLEGLPYLNSIALELSQKENVILLANHQTEADPQAIGILFEKTHPKIASDIIFVAGERVTTDPLAVPFSMGCNLLCIYSKRYIDHPPELKEKKQLHNKRTMQLMSGLLSEGGKCIYVAPSGGRDRPNLEGKVEVAPFDPQSLEMFYLMAQKAHHPTHFYPMALATYDLLPPPEDIQIELGEKRSAKRGGIHLALCPKIDMEHFPGSEAADRHERRKLRADYIQAQVAKKYQKYA